MDELTMNTAAPEHAAAKPEFMMSDQLEAQPDDTLRELMLIALAILQNRTTARRREAIAEIHRLAKENDLTVSIKKPAQKRGRPSKTGPATTQKKESA